MKYVLCVNIAFYGYLSPPPSLFVYIVFGKPAYLWSEEEDIARESVLELKVECDVGLFPRSLLDSLDELLLLLS